ncbi:Thioesterase/thiol ester dehydrase-isomerase [Gonapodya prolifera JEL478]|uniref:Thioesterase/thiol ester dehydrase-isomerase n=1 Tax=Gonapodya prolifera (strain JEL478) TaxID=1344416 RepID=A0A139AWY5_GONPJ|nr:Thioesterase/thiol ester dehydrase-isomerase [Gonapodya prolifera JEL478]|eukprot:KXS21214.1 Thioesterase/thiol ester dehydrase-isomerase [Gonapodya prolifera JEL478]
MSAAGPTKTLPSAEVFPRREPKQSHVSRTLHTHVIRPEEVDDTGVAYGGEILALIDVVGVVCAQRHSDMWGSCVTASVDAVHFLSPIRLGDTITLQATCNRAWRTSMEVGVRVEAANIRSGVMRHACQAYLTFVALSSDPSKGHSVPVPVPEVIPQTADERRRWVEAEERREKRIAAKSGSSTTVRPSKPSPTSTSSTSPTPSTTPTLSPEPVATPTLDSPSPRSHFPSLNGRSGFSAAGPVRSSSASVTEMTHVVFPQHVNNMGNAFGGQVLKWMESCAHLSAYRHAREHVLTASMDSVHFARGIMVSDILTIRSQTSRTWHSSLEVYVTVTVQRPASRRPGEVPRTETFLANRGYVTLVAVDSSGGKVSVPQALPRGAEEVERWKGGEARRRERLEGRRELERREGYREQALRGKL